MAAPDYAGALIGWRVWCVRRRHAELRLASVIADELWPVETALVATCRADEIRATVRFAGERAPHRAPDPACTCGVYAAREPASVWTYLRGRDEPETIARVLGRVLLWGRVVEHERGWRAERAYPLELFTGDPQLRRRLNARRRVVARTMPRT